MFLTKKMSEELKKWKREGYLSEGYKIVVNVQEACDVNYIFISLMDESGEMEESIDLDKEYDDKEINQMKKDGKKVRSEIARKLDISTKNIEINEFTV